MNGGYVMIDCSGLNLTPEETQTMPGIYEAVKTAMKTGKPVQAYGCVYQEREVTPIDVFCVDYETCIICTSSILQVVVYPDDTLEIRNMVTPEGGNE